MTKEKKKITVNHGCRSSDGETEKEENVYAQSTRSPEHVVGDVTVGRKMQKKKNQKP